MQALESVRPDNSSKAGGKAKGKKTKTVDTMIKKKIISDGSDGDDDEFEIKKPVARPVKVSAPKLKQPQIAPAAFIAPKPPVLVKKSAPPPKKSVFDFDDEYSISKKNAAHSSKKVTRKKYSSSESESSVDFDSGSEEDGDSDESEMDFVVAKPVKQQKKSAVIEINEDESDFPEPAPSKMKKMDEDTAASKQIPVKRSSPSGIQLNQKKRALGGKKAVVSSSAVSALKKSVVQVTKKPAPKQKTFSESSSDAEGTVADDDFDDIVEQKPKPKPIARAKKLNKPIIIDSDSDASSEQSAYSVYSSAESD